MRLGQMILFLIVCNGCQFGSDFRSDNETCGTISFRIIEAQQINPVSLLENGEYLFDDGVPLSRACAQARICQVNNYTRENYSQSYYVTLDSIGGLEIARQFPEVVKSIQEGRGSSKAIYLNNFCRATKP